MSVDIPAAVRQSIRALDHESCAYCHSPEALMGVTFEIEHILPLASGGETRMDNL